MWFDRKFFTSDTSPLNLAIFRFIFFIIVATQLEWDRLLFLSEMPQELRFPPPGLGWLVPWLPIDPTLTKITGSLLIFTSLLAAVGFYSRLMAFLTAILSFYVFGIDRFFGDVSHNHHHIVPFSLLMAFSPCGDALSIDSWRAGRLFNPPPPSNIYSLPLRLIWLMIGVLYFFPGFWKLYHSGISWGLSENMKYQLYGKWFWTQWTPYFRIDQYPIIYKSSGLFTLFFETCFIFFLFIPRLRVFTILLGFFFHIMTAIFLHVAFWSLLSCYSAFIDWDRLLKKCSFKQYFIEGKPFSFANSKCLIPLASTMLILNISLGFAHERFTWPFACYPDFRGCRGPQNKTLEFVLLNQQKEPLSWNQKKTTLSFNGKRFRSMLKKIMTTKDEEKKQERLKSLLQLWRAQDPTLDEAAYIQTYKVTNWVEPEKLAENPISKKLIYEANLAPR